MGLQNYDNREPMVMGAKVDFRARHHAFVPTGEQKKGGDPSSPVILRPSEVAIMRTTTRPSSPGTALAGTESSSA